MVDKIKCERCEKLRACRWYRRIISYIPVHIECRRFCAKCKTTLNMAGQKWEVINLLPLLRYIPKTLPTMPPGQWAVYDTQFERWLISGGYPAIRTDTWEVINERCKELNSNHADNLSYLNKTTKASGCGQ